MNVFKSEMFYNGVFTKRKSLSLESVLAALSI